MVGRPRSAPDTLAPDSGRITVPSLNQDPIQSLQPWPVAVTYLNQDLVIPALPAVDWLTVLMSENLQLDDIFPGLLSEEDTDFIEEQIILGRLGADEFRDLIFAIIETASARKWYITLRLVNLARSSWDAIGSEMLLRGVDAGRISLSGWLDIFLLTVLRNMESKDITMFTMRLEAPPPEEEPEEPEMSTASFLALAGE